MAFHINDFQRVLIAPPDQAITALAFIALFGEMPTHIDQSKIHTPDFTMAWTRRTNTILFTLIGKCPSCNKPTWSNPIGSRDELVACRESFQPHETHECY